MSEFRLSFPARVVAGKQKLSADDILLSRILTFPEDGLTLDDVTPHPAMNNSRSDRSAEGNSYCVEHPPHHCLRDRAPFGAVGTAKDDSMRHVLADDLADRWLKVPDRVFLENGHAS